MTRRDRARILRRIDEAIRNAQVLSTWLSVARKWFEDGNLAEADEVLRLAAESEVAALAADALMALRCPVKSRALAKKVEP